MPSRRRRRAPHSRTRWSERTSLLLHWAGHHAPGGRPAARGARLPEEGSSGPLSTASDGRTLGLPGRWRRAARSQLRALVRGVAREVGSPVRGVGDVAFVEHMGGPCEGLRDGPWRLDGVRCLQGFPHGLSCCIEGFGDGSSGKVVERSAVPRQGCGQACPGCDALGQEHGGSPRVRTFTSTWLARSRSCRTACAACGSPSPQV